MALDTYTNLKTAIATWSSRADTAAVVDDAIVLTEARFNRTLRNRQMDASTSLTALTRAVALPSDFLSARNVNVVGNPNRPLKFVSPDQMDLYDNQATTGKPRLYTIIGSNIILAPPPDQTYQINLEYYQRIPALASASTNWLLTLYPDLYLYGCLCQLKSWLQDEQTRQLVQDTFDKAWAEANTQDDEAQYSGSMMRIRSDANLPSYT